MVRKTTKSKKSKAVSATAPVNAIKAVSTVKEVDAPKAEGDLDATAQDGTEPKQLGKREMIERVVIASGIKKKAAKPVVEAVLKELGEALARGETLNLQPFGKANVKRYKELEHAEIIEIRLRRSKLAIKASQATDEAATPLDPLAEAAE